MALITVMELMMTVKESLVDGGMVQFQFQLKPALTGQLPSPPGCKTSFRGSRFQRAGSPIAVKVLTSLKVFFLGNESISAVACFSFFRDALLIRPKKAVL